MHVEFMSDEIHRFLMGASTLARKKNRDYHPDDVAMLEIFQTASETGTTVEQDLWGRVRKQMSALRRFLIDGHLESEPPEERLRDVANYMAILAFWVAHKSQTLADAETFVVENRPCEFGNPSRCQDCDPCQLLAWIRRQRAHLPNSPSADPSSSPTPKPPA